MIGALAAKLLALALVVATAAAGLQTWRLDALQDEIDAERAAKVAAALALSENHRRLEATWRGRVQGVQDAKEAELRRVRDAAAADLDQLRSRAERADSAASSAAARACAGATGAELSRPDAAFLAGEAARADTLRAELAACQQREHAVR